MFSPLFVILLGCYTLLKSFIKYEDKLGFYTKESFLYNLKGRVYSALSNLLHDIKLCIANKV